MNSEFSVCCSGGLLESALRATSHPSFTLTVTYLVKREQGLGESAQKRILQV